MKTQNIVTIGGGLGSSSVLNGLKKYNTNLSAIVTVFDNGGSSGRLQKSYNVLPPGDILKNLIALSNLDKTYQKLFTYRFQQGELKGHTFGNILITTLFLVLKDFNKVLDFLYNKFQTKGKIIPISLEYTELCATTDKQIIIGQEQIKTALSQDQIIQKLYLQKNVPLNQKVKKIIQTADKIIFGPGNIFTSILPNLLVENFQQIIQQSKAKKIFIMNPIIEIKQLKNYNIFDFVTLLEKYLGKNQIDIIIINTGKIDENIKINNKKISEILFKPKTNIISQFKKHLKIIKANLINEIKIKENINQENFSPILYDSKKLAEIIYKL